MEKYPKIVPISGLRPEDVFKGPMVRRLCILNFQCPLCMEEHEAEIYISLPAEDLDEYVAKLRPQANNWKFIEPLLTRKVIQFHEELGDLDVLARRAGAEGIRKTRAPTLELTGESNYTCDECSRTFDSIRELREHMENCA